MTPCPAVANSHAPSRVTCEQPQLGSPSLKSGWGQAGPMKNIVVSVAFVLASAASLYAWPASAGSLDELPAAKAAMTRRDYDAAERSAGAALNAGDLKGDDLATAYFLRGYA